MFITPIFYDGLVFDKVLTLNVVKANCMKDYFHTSSSSAVLVNLVYPALEQRIALVI